MDSFVSFSRVIIISFAYFILGLIDGVKGERDSYFGEFNCTFNLHFLIILPRLSEFTLVVIDTKLTVGVGINAMCAPYT